ncbi:glycogen synthase GlgA [Clostridium tagluense]|uniref:glycogen synthase GlgA n=1 Tax=Clostridium tagluense TaxID=360422 RepID=UPI001C0D2EE4|nr:glycogen synthase GlgA [Clostridium tagluense]MBU3127114.1 glycogen synthase GlgA [Clostridium tagluense]MCB2311982.1 glycogen synthase GlgA [Clostridium tagluense]MCB2316569.1 glycogen synthase GlgA [Clostridium tagluense]MCB2321495.1 glycogen synthase GlgA [Clostridium tagluense]MCB2326507.1 glycogen synthase GlgA [Clostridium tagluense]
MKVLFVASEAYPFIKTGGLGDVAYALPKALRKMGIDARVIIPKYSTIPLSFKNCMENLASFTVPVGWRNQYCGLKYLTYEDIPYYFVDNEYYFERPEIYGCYDDGERYSYFSKAVLESIKHMGDFVPDIIHCNDWHSGILPALLKDSYSDDEMYSEIKSVFTIHNLKYQGVFPKEILDELLNLDEGYFSDDALKFYDAISFMKGGIVFADAVTTVSETYAGEIQTPFYGEGLDGLLRSKSEKLYGIVNGIDYELYNPKVDKKIFYNFDSDSIKQKVKNKLKLQNQLSFTVNENIPLVGIVTRLVKQKGLDLIVEKLQELLSLPIQIVLLGNGDGYYEDIFQYYASIYPSRISTNIVFDEVLAQKIYAASDMFLMPSLFEPCGIGQLIALKYGSIPIVRETGGLKDTIIPYNKYTGTGNGFSFENYSSDELMDTITSALNLYDDKDSWNKLVKNAMISNNSWESSAKNYMDLYSNLID